MGVKPRATPIPSALSPLLFSPLGTPPAPHHLAAKRQQKGPQRASFQPTIPPVSQQNQQLITGSVRKTAGFCWVLVALPQFLISQFLSFTRLTRDTHRRLFSLSRLIFGSIRGGLGVLVLVFTLFNILPTAILQMCCFCSLSCLSSVFLLLSAVNHLQSCLLRLFPPLEPHPRILTDICLSY